MVKKYLSFLALFLISSFLISFYTPIISARFLAFFDGTVSKRQSKPFSFEKALREHRLPSDHPIRKKLDTLFSQGRVIESLAALKGAGFSILSQGLVSYTTIVNHPDCPGFVFKLYLDDQLKSKEGKSHNYWLAQRCIGAKKIRKLIKKKKLCHFSVPDKWLYELPPSVALKEKRAANSLYIDQMDRFVLSSGENLPSVIVVETDMQLVSEQESEIAWKLADREILDELYSILKRGYGSYGLIANIPYTKNGRFAFIDTEYPRRAIRLKKIRKYLSEDMAAYWEKISNLR